jgi:Tol biopolymer transport system component
MPGRWVRLRFAWRSAVGLCAAVGLVASACGPAYHQKDQPGAASSATTAHLALTSLKTVRVSIASAGLQAKGDSGGVGMSSNPRIAVFVSDASNLASGDHNGTNDVFVHEHSTGTTALVSVSLKGTPGNGNSNSASISADGRYVVFDSLASNIVAGDTNSIGDVFVRDLSTGQTSLVSVIAGGDPGNGYSGTGLISADGQHVAFYSQASNLITGDTNEAGDVFVRDLSTGQTTRVSVASDGSQARAREKAGSSPSAISGDGRFVVFGSYATNLVPGDTNGEGDVFVHDMQTRETVRVSVNSRDRQANDASSGGSITADGRLVAFSSIASNLAGGDDNGQYDVFVHDMQTGVTRLVSLSSKGSQGNLASINGVLSPDGRLVFFESEASNLVPGDDNAPPGFAAADIFVHDLSTGLTKLLSVNSDGEQGNHSSYRPVLSPDGRYLMFSSYATNLVRDDTNKATDAFVRGPMLGG